MSEIDVQGQQYINGRLRRGGSAEEFEVIDPSTGEVVARDNHASPADVNEAVAAAKEAFKVWSATPPVERANAIAALADELQHEFDSLAAQESQQAGKPIRMAREFDIPGAIDNIRYFAGISRDAEGTAAGNFSGGHISTIRREPLGVIGSISPWNYPLQVGVWKILPAIAAGNTIVLKPSELTPGTSVRLAQAAQAAGIPDGVINIVTAAGPIVGDALISHTDIAMVSFTGSTAVGKQIGARAAGLVKRVHLELGGKAPFVVFDDANLDAAARGAVAASVVNAGQDCTAATRAYVQRPYYNDFVEAVASYMAHVTPGPTADPATDLGSLISRKHRHKVHGYVLRAQAEGAKVVTGGRFVEGELEKGAYYEPTLIVDAAQNSAIVQEELFGPVLTVLPFDSDDEGFDLANDTQYGLAASAWTTSVFRSQAAAERIQAGCVWLNDHISIISEMPHGGYKLSGFGKDMSSYSLEEYTQIKHVMSSTTNDAHRAWHDVVFTVT